LIETIDPRERYLASLREKIDVDAIAKSGLRIAVDSLYGTARDYLDYFLLDTNIEIKSIHNYRDPYFGGYSPECDQKNLASLRRVVLTEKYDVGLATDCDADRFGIIDERDRFVSPNHILALLALYMKRNRGTEGGLARSVATTHLIDLIAREFDVPLYETPVGFKYIGQLILEDKLAFGGEESAGLGIRDHLPEKDGILACLLVAEMLATTRKTLTSLIDEMFHEFGPRFTKRIDLKLTPQLQERMVEKLKNPPKEIDGIKVAKVKKVDGVKLIFDEQRWLLFRLSGTEPVVRLYAEACTPKDLKALVDMGRKLVKG
jgi:phosphoglucomutase